jgi:hypothetical protein
MEKIMASEFNQAFQLHNMVPGPAGTGNVQIIYRSEDGILDCYGHGYPSNGSKGFATGCTHRRTNGGNGTALYVNEGDIDSASFKALEAAN